MTQKPAKSRLPASSRFSAVSCSGFFIDPALVTAACILFEEVHLLNDIEYAVEFARRFRFGPRAGHVDKPEGRSFLDVLPEDAQAGLGILALTSTQLETLELYTDRVMSFCERYFPLFGNVIRSDFAPQRAVSDVVLEKQGAPGEKSRFRVRVELSAQWQGGEGFSAFDRLIRRGAVPLVTTSHLINPVGAG